jgi:hypothetical protein
VSERVVHVRRTITIEYTVPVTAYEGMTEAEIRAWESDPDNTPAEVILDNIVSEGAEVWFSGDAE